MVAACVGAPRDPEMDDDLKALIEQINRNTAAQKEQTKKWRQELGLPDPEPTELELLLQKWEQAEEAWLSAAPVREAPESPAPEVLQGEQEEETVPEPEEVSTTPPPQLQTTTPEEDPALVSAVPCPLLLDTLPVFLDLPAFGLEPRNLHHQPQLCPWFPTPLSPNTQTSLGCCQTSLVLPLFAAKLPLGDRTSLRRSPGEDLCPLLHSPVPRLSLRSPLSSRWGPKSPFQGPVLKAPEEPTHPQARPCKRVKIDICGLEEDYPSGTWLGDESNAEMRVRSPISAADMLHISTNCRTAEKMALTLLDYLFHREIQAVSNLSGQGKHGKKQLDPLMIYGIRCHLFYKFGITESDWYRIKQSIDSKCRTAWRRKQRGQSLAVKSFSRRTPAASSSYSSTDGLQCTDASPTDGQQTVHYTLSNTQQVQIHRIGEDGQMQVGIHSALQWTICCFGPKQQGKRQGHLVTLPLSRHHRLRSSGIRGHRLGHSGSLRAVHGALQRSLIGQAGDAFEKHSKVSFMKFGQRFETAFLSEGRKSSWWNK
ncbi:UNVERIFIED_CONTAM: hypothetical protein FKN15_070711 [Acipenser sinensis]